MKNNELASGKLVLEGGSEFLGKMSIPDLRALELAGGMEVPIVIVTTAAVPDHNHWRAGANGARWFHQLGAQNVSISEWIDQESGRLPEVVDELRDARLIYLLGGFPGYLVDTMRDSLAWKAIRLAYQDGAVIAGSSAGAMVLCEQLYDPARSKLVPGLGLLPRTCFLPHYNTFGHTWVKRLKAHLPALTLLGVDEQTGLVWDGQSWQVLGVGRAVLVQDGNIHTYPAGTFLPDGSLPVSRSD